MVSVFSFIFALFAIIGMIAFKNWEIKAGITVFREFRFKADRITILWSSFVKGNIPTEGKHLSKKIMHNTVYYISHAALAVVRFAEQKLVRIINFIKGKGIVKKDRTTSHYLKNVSEYDRHPDRK